MKKIVSLLLALVMLVGLTATLVACAPEDEGAEIAIYLGNEIYDFDPTDYYVDSNAEQVMSLLFEPLFRYTENGKLENAAAKSYTVDETERKIVIELRESYWSNDTRVKAADFVYAWCEKLLNPNVANPAAALLYDIENAAEVKSGVISLSDVAVEATDVYELTITYREGADYKQLLRNLSSLATSPVRQANVDAAPTYWSKFFDTLASNGPFKVKKYNLDSAELVLERNVGYHQSPDVADYDNQVTPGQLVGFVTSLGTEIEVSYKDIEEKTVFYMQDASLQDRSTNKGSAVVKDDTSVYAYVFNTAKAPFDNPDVRRALSLAIDREAIVSAVTFGKAADGFLPDVSGGSTEELIAKTANLELAQELVDGAELSTRDKRITLTIADDEESKAVAELVKTAWESLGFTVTVKAVTYNENNVSSNDIKDSTVQALVKDAALGDVNFDVIAVDWQTYTNDAFVGLCAFTSSMNGSGKDFTTGSLRAGISGWMDSEYDRLIADAYKATGEERSTLLAQAEKLLCEAMPVIPIMFNQNIAFASEDLSNIKYDGFGNAILTKVQQKDYKNYLEKEEHQ